MIRRAVGKNRLAVERVNNTVHSEQVYTVQSLKTVFVLA